MTIPAQIVPVLDRVPARFLDRHLSGRRRSCRGDLKAGRGGTDDWLLASGPEGWTPLFFTLTSPLPPISAAWSVVLC